MMHKACFTAMATLLLVPCLSGGAEPEGWRRFDLPAEGATVSALVATPLGIALGTTSSGVHLVDPRSGTSRSLWESRSPRGRRIRSLAWLEGSLWVASEAGMLRWEASTGKLDSSLPDLSASQRASVRLVGAWGHHVWMASAKSLACLVPGQPESYREWAIPLPDAPVALLRAGGRLLVGTESKGLFLLDSATGLWMRWSRAEGLSSNQVVGLEWVGSEVVVATPEGIDLLDLSSRKVRPLFEQFSSSWMAQANGILYATTTDGLVRLDVAARKASLVALPPGEVAQGALVSRSGWLALGTARSLLVRPLASIFGEEPFLAVPTGVSVAVDRKALGKGRVQACARMPEWPEVKVALPVEWQDGTDRILVRMGEETRGVVQLELDAVVDSVVLESRSEELRFDRPVPSIQLEPARAVQRDSILEWRGKVVAAAGLALRRHPGGATLQVGPDGSFRDRIGLARGANRIRYELLEGETVVSLREAQVRRDDQAPRLDSVAPDTVTGDYARVRVRVHDQSALVATVRGAGQSRVSVYDSFLVLEARMLRPGRNLLQVTVVDEAGNSATIPVAVVRTGTNATFSVNTWALDAYHPFGRPDEPDSLGSARGVSVVRYSMADGETLCGVAERFYGSQLLAQVLIQWNGFQDSSQWRKMPVGTPVEIPFWRDIDHREPDVRSILESFPWDRRPVSRRDER